jgi:hypothetical protein
MEVITKALPEDTHWMQGGRGGGTNSAEPEMGHPIPSLEEGTDVEDSLSRVCSSSISNNFRGNCCGHPLFPVLGKLAAAEVLEVGIARETAAALVVVRAPSTDPEGEKGASTTAPSAAPDHVGLLAPLL